MEKKCLVTKFSTSINDDRLKKVGELRIKFNKVTKPTKQTQGFLFSFTKDVGIDIVGDGYFTDESLSENLGKHIDAKGNQPNAVYVSNSDLEISISDKYSLYSVSAFAVQNLADLNEGIGKVLNSSEFRYCNNLNSVNITDTPSIGSYSDFKDLKSLVNLYTLNTKITGEMDDLKDLQNLTNLYCSGIKGSVNVLGSTKFHIIYLKDSDVYGDIAILPKTLTLFRGDNKTFNWSSRNSNANIISLIAVKLNNVDKMLQDQAQCIISSSQNNKQISVTGTRTSASDEAVATLQSKGYTVSITPA